MPRRIRIRTKKNRTEVLRAVNRAIAEVIPPYVVREVLTENMRDFLAKSAGGSDREGERWKSLATSTRKRKISKFKKRPVQVKAYQRAIERFSQQGAFTGLSPAQARASAIEAANAIFGFTGHVPINVDTRRMIDSLQPGEISGTRYVPPPDQSFRQHRRGYRVATRVPYAKYPHRARPIMMPNHVRQRWVRQGTQRAMVPLANEIKKAL